MASSLVKTGGQVSVDTAPLLAAEAPSAANELAVRVEDAAQPVSELRQQVVSAPRASLARRGFRYLGNNPKCAAVGCLATTALAFVGMYFLSKMAVG